MKRFTKTRVIAFIAILVAALMFVACTPQAEVDSVTLDITSKSLKISETVKLTATVTAPDEATSTAVTWSSSNTSVASAGSDGTVTARAAGSATITATSQANTSKKATCSITVTDGVYKTAGTYKVGTDIEAGEYLLITTTQSDNALSTGYYAVKNTANASAGSSDFLYNDNFYYRTYILVTDGQYLEFSSGCKLYKIADYPAVNKNAASWHSGQYKVGVDLEPGEYKLTTLANNSILDSAYVEITRTPNGKIGTSDFISNDLFQNQKYVTLTAGTYIEFNSATLTKVS